MTERAQQEVWAVILAGGAGMRLWPAAGPKRPKPFLPLLRGRSLFSRTWSRATALAGAGRVLVVCGNEQVPWVRRQAPGISEARIVREMTGRNTAASVALAAHWLRQRAGDAIMVILPADHHVHPSGTFLQTARRAIAAARDGLHLVLVGIPALGPETGFGWIQAGPGSRTRRVREVTRFIEKPDARTARRLHRSGNYFWNSGIFAWRASAIIEDLERWEPRIARGVAAWARRAGRTWRIPARVMRRLPELPIDRAVLERSDRLLVVPARFAWSDLGNWAAVADMLGEATNADAGAGETLSEGAIGCVGFNPGGMTAFVGVRDLVVVRVGTVVLVCRRDAAQNVRRVADRLRGRLSRFR